MKQRIASFPTAALMGSALALVAGCAPLLPHSSASSMGTGIPSGVSSQDISDLARQATQSRDLGIICKKRSTVGSRIEKTVCTTSEQRALMHSSGKRFLETMQTQALTSG